jgi:hypothetical protein
MRYIASSELQLFAQDFLKWDEKEKRTVMCRRHDVVRWERGAVVGKSDVCEHDLGERFIDSEAIWVGEIDTTQLAYLEMELECDDGERMRQ